MFAERRSGHWNQRLGRSVACATVTRGRRANARPHTQVLSPANRSASKRNARSSPVVGVRGLRGGHCADGLHIGTEAMHRVAQGVDGPSVRDTLTSVQMSAREYSLRGFALTHFLNTAVVSAHSTGLTHPAITRMCSYSVPAQSAGFAARVY